MSDGDKDYIVTREVKVINGKSMIIICRHPVLEPEEREQRHQEFLKVADKILTECNMN